MNALDLRGLSPAPITPFTRDGEVDYDAIQRLGSWLGSVEGVKSLVVLGHAGEGTFLTQAEQAKVIGAFRDSVDGKLPIVAGITGEGTAVSVEEAKRAVDAGASCRRRLRWPPSTRMRHRRDRERRSSNRPVRQWVLMSGYWNRISGKPDPSYRAL